MNDFSTKSAMVLDSYLFAELAVKLSESFGKVRYFAESLHEPFPYSKKGLVGAGFPKVERVLNWEDYVKDTDIFICPDINWGPTQQFLRGMGKRVFGSGMADELENKRDKLKELMEAMDLPVGKWRKIVGLDALRKYLKTVEDKYVKINLWRGDGESMKSVDYKIVESRLDRWEQELGQEKYTKLFIIEDEIPDCEEIGQDFWCADGQYPQNYLAGIEVKGLGYIGEIKNDKDLPDELKSFSQTMSPVYKKYGYRGFMSNEVRVGKERIPYMIDLCCRMPSPPGDLYLEMYDNLTDIIWNCAEGKIVEPVTKHKFGIQTMVYSDWCKENEQCLEFPEKYRKNIKMRYAHKTKDGYFILPFKDNTRLCAIVYTGDTLQECVDGVLEIADEIKSFDKDIRTESIDSAIKSFENLKKWGMPIIDPSDLKVKLK
jgi:hypothetical protein